MKKVLGKSFFNRKTVVVAHDLLGKYLVRKIGGKTFAQKITEVEAYIGPHDKASHASKGRTARTEIMFSSAGTFYVYLVYGMYWMLNVVTEKEDYPAGILIRSTGDISGPGRLTKTLRITKSLNGKQATGKNGLWFEDRGEKVNRKKIIRTPRIGVSYAGPIWANKKYRFLIMD